MSFKVNNTIITNPSHVFPRNQKELLTFTFYDISTLSDTASLTILQSPKSNNNDSYEIKFENGNRTSELTPSTTISETIILHLSGTYKIKVDVVEDGVKITHIIIFEAKGLKDSLLTPYPGEGVETSDAHGWSRKVENSIKSLSQYSGTVSYIGYATTGTYDLGDVVVVETVNTTDITGFMHNFEKVEDSDFDNSMVGIVIGIMKDDGDVKYANEIYLVAFMGAFKLKDPLSSSSSSFSDGDSVYYNTSTFEISSNPVNSFYAGKYYTNSATDETILYLEDQMMKTYEYETPLSGLFYYTSEFETTEWTETGTGTDIYTYSFNHQLNSPNLIVEIWDDNDKVKYLDDYISKTDNNNIEIQFTSAFDGRIVIMRPDVNTTTEITPLIDILDDGTSIDHPSNILNFVDGSGVSVTVSDGGPKRTDIEFTVDTSDLPILHNFTDEIQGGSISTSGTDHEMDGGAFYVNDDKLYYGAYSVDTNGILYPYVGITDISTGKLTHQLNFSSSEMSNDTIEHYVSYIYVDDDYLYVGVGSILTDNKLLIYNKNTYNLEYTILREGSATERNIHNVIGIVLLGNLLYVMTYKWTLFNSYKNIYTYDKSSSFSITSTEALLIDSDSIKIATNGTDIFALVYDSTTPTISMDRYPSNLATSAPISMTLNGDDLCQYYDFRFNDDKFYISSIDASSNKYLAIYNVDGSTFTPSETGNINSNLLGRFCIDDYYIYVTTNENTSIIYDYDNITFALSVITYPDPIYLSLKDVFHLTFDEYVAIKDYDDSNVVHISGDETISDTKTFTILPQSADTPIVDDDLVNKAYVDSQISTGAFISIPEESVDIVNRKIFINATGNAGKIQYRGDIIITGSGSPSINPVQYFDNYFLGIYNAPQISIFANKDESDNFHGIYTRFVTVESGDYYGATAGGNYVEFNRYDTESGSSMNATSIIYRDASIGVWAFKGLVDDSKFIVDVSDNTNSEINLIQSDTQYIKMTDSAIYVRNADNHIWLGALLTLHGAGSGIIIEETASCDSKISLGAIGSETGVFVKLIGDEDKLKIYRENIEGEEEDDNLFVISTYSATSSGTVNDVFSVTHNNTTTSNGIIHNGIQEIVHEKIGEPDISIEEDVSVIMSENISPKEYATKRTMYFAELPSSPEIGKMYTIYSHISPTRKYVTGGSDGSVNYYYRHLEYSIDSLSTTYSPEIIDEAGTIKLRFTIDQYADFKDRFRKRELIIVVDHDGTNSQNFKIISFDDTNRKVNIGSSTYLTTGNTATMIYRFAGYPTIIKAGGVHDFIMDMIPTDNIGIPFLPPYGYLQSSIPDDFSMSNNYLVLFPGASITIMFYDGAWHPSGAQGYYTITSDTSDLFTELLLESIMIATY